MPNRNLLKLARSGLEFRKNLVDIWMDKSSSAAGHTFIGLVLTEAFYSRKPWVSAQYVSKEMAIYSLDTVRRRLEEMVDDGLVEFTEIDNKKIYRAKPKAAEATIKLYRDFAESCRILRQDSQNASVN